MNHDNVKLWFAKNGDELVTIDEINEENKNKKYSCPVCGSDLKPKAIKSKQVSSHFAHVDSSKCNSETMIHWWFKHKFLEVGDTFTVVSDKERQYIVKEVMVEKAYKVVDNEYKPDVTIHTECGDIIYFEMAFSNKKKIKDYLDIWLELKNIVVEIDIKQLMSKSKIPTFKALFYDGKCFNAKRNDTYYNTIGKYKEEKSRSEYSERTKKQIKKLDWFWRDIERYNNSEVDIEYMVALIDSIDVVEVKAIVQNILKKTFCSNLYKEYKEFKSLDEFAKFEDTFKDDNIVINSINILNEKYNGNIEVKLKEVPHYKYKTRYNGSRKHPYVSYVDGVSHFTFTILVRRNGRNIHKIPVTNRLYKQFSSSDIIINYVNNIINNHVFRIRCASCNKIFTLENGEFNFFISKGFKLPRRCKPCRDKRKGGRIIEA